MSRRRLLLITMLPTWLILIALSTVSLGAQEEKIRLRLSTPETGEFPNISLKLVALDSESNVITDITGLRLVEDGLLISDIHSKTIDAGVEIVFVIDANSDIEERDEAGGLSRREKVRDSINRYIDQFTDPGDLDRYSIIVPEGSGGRFLDEPGMMFPTAVKNAINFYMPAELGDTPLNSMLEMAVQQAERGTEEGRFPVIVLFTDGAELNEQLDFEGLVDQTTDSQAVFYGAILGDRADPWEIEDVERLTGPTGGMVVHMPEAGAADPLFETIQRRSSVKLITYRSTLNSSGQHTLVAALDGGSGEVVFDLVIAPPVVRLLMDYSRSLIRATNDHEAALEDIEPKIQTLEAEVSWPDGYPRELTTVSLLVDAVSQPAITPVIDTGGYLTFDWDIRKLGEGVYAVQVQVADELELIAVSEPIPLVIEVDRPPPPATSTPIPVPTAVQIAEPANTAIPEPAALLDLARENIRFIWAGGLLFLVVVVVFIIALGLIRAGRKKEERDLPSPGGYGGFLYPPAPERTGSDATYAMMPDFEVSRITSAYLEALDHAPEYATLIPLTGDNVALGRDPKVAQIVFNDRSVSRLHARILESQGSYRVHDEGSTSGTYVNFERIGLSPRVLENRDDIHFGRVHVRFHLASPPADAEADGGKGSERANEETIDPG